MSVLIALVLASLALWPSVAAAQAVKVGAVVPLTCLLYTSPSPRDRG